MRGQLFDDDIVDHFHKFILNKLIIQNMKKF